MPYRLFFALAWLGMMFAAFAAQADPANRISGPHSFRNLTIFLVHGPSAPGAVPLTLAEGLQTKAVEIIETGRVQALEIENRGDRPVFIQRGEIVKGGRQDRVLTVSMMLPPRSGRMAIGAYCVERGRWSRRGLEDAGRFVSSTSIISPRCAKIPMMASGKTELNCAELTMREPVRQAAPARQRPDIRPRAAVRPRNTIRPRPRSNQQVIWNNVARLQNDMGMVKQDIAAIKKSAERTAVATERTARAVEEVAKGVEGLGKLGGLINVPKTITDFYNNALVFERRGDSLSARRMYEKAITLRTEAIDLHQRYAALLKAQEGLPGAREIYADLARSQPGNKTVALTRAVLLPGTARETALRALVESREPFAPAWYEIARLYSLDRLGQQSLSDKKNEKQALEAFDKADRSGGVYKHFLKKEAAEKWRETVAARLAPYRAGSVDVSSVTLSATPSNSTWTLSVNLAEPAHAIRYRVDDGETKETGHMNFVNQVTGAKQPRTFFHLPLSTRKAAIDIWYDDVRGKEQGPFRQQFDARKAHVAHTRNILENLTPNWVSGRDFNGKFLVYFSHLLSYKCGLKEISYGIDENAPEKSWPLPACDLTDPHTIGSDAKIYQSFDRKIGSMSVRLTYADGSQSPLKEFRF